MENTCSEAWQAGLKRNGNLALASEKRGIYAATQPARTSLTLESFLF
jgi:hypothetical protein